MDDTHAISAGGITAAIKADGAELCSLKAADGLELLWQAGPAWARHAPWLFPIVGRLTNDDLRHGGKSYKLTQHGFARDLRFQWLQRTGQSCTLRLMDSAATRQRYPFGFRLDITYAIDAACLDMTVGIANTGEKTLPASFGAHPAFNWPLLPGVPKESYSLIFEEPEPAAIRRLAGGLMRTEAEPSPVQGRVLSLTERLFEADAVILDAPASRAVRYAGPSGPSLEIAWSGFRELGIWSKPSGAPFLCIEPWRGFASPIGFDGAFSDKPGLMLIAPGETQTLQVRITVGGEGV
jgi:galactose mutarotase-like enzyme